MNKTKNDLFILLSVSFLTRIVFFFLTDDIFGDPADKIVEALRWIQSPEFITHGYWLPLHNYLIALVIVIFKNPSMSPRILSIAAGTLTLIPYYFLVKKLFSRKAAFYSGLFLSFLYYHILYSTQTMNDTIFILLSITSLLFFFRTYEKESHCNDSFINPVACGIFLFIAGMTRVEGWILIPVMFFALLLRKKYVQAFTVAAISSLFPILWFAGNYSAMGSILPLADINIKSGAFENYNIISKLLIYPYMLLKTFTPLVSFLSFAGCLISIKKRKNFPLLLFIAVELSFLTATVLKGTNAFPKPRYCLFAGILLFPFIFDFLDSIFSKQAMMLKRTVVAVLIISVPTTYVYLYKKNPSEFLPRMPSYVVQTGEWIKKNVGSEEKIFLDGFGWWNSNIAVKAEINPRNLARIYPDPFPGIITGNKYYQQKNDGFKKYTLEVKPDYIVFNPGGTLEKWLGASIINYLEGITSANYTIVFDSQKVVILKKGK